MRRFPTILSSLALVLLLVMDAGAVPDPACPHPTSLRPLMVYGDLSRSETVAFSPSLQRAENVERHDPWLAFDKVQHFSFSLLITVGSQYTYVNKLHMRERRALPISMITSASVGLAKEIYDWKYGPSGFFSRRDMAANAAGIIVAAGFILL